MTATEYPCYQDFTRCTPINTIYKHSKKLSGPVTRILNVEPSLAAYPLEVRVEGPEYFYQQQVTAVRGPE